MNVGRGLGLVGRLVTALVGIALIAAGAYGIAFWADVDFPDRWPVYLDRQWYFSAADQSWWPWALVGVAVLSIVVGALLVALHLRPRRAPQVSVGRTDLGALSIEPSAVGDAVAAQLADLPDVEGADARARVVGGQETITLNVRAVPDADVDELRAKMVEFAGAVADSLGKSTPCLRFILGFSAPDPAASKVK